jgi:L-glyceraldehyde 3-phosphate reductase
MPYTANTERYNQPAGFYRRCGRSGLLLPTVSLGCWHNFGGAGTDSLHSLDDTAIHANAKAMLFAAFDLGITHFDLANNYGPPPGSAEERVGRILHDDLAAHRDELIIATKAGYGMWPGPYGDWGSRKYLLSSLDASLKRLKLEYVDIFYHHRPDPQTPLEETLGALDQAVKSGKALYAAVSSYRGGQTAKVAEVCAQHHLTRPILHQPVYSMFNRWIENELIPVAEAAGMGLMCFSPLAQGQLTDKYLNGIPKDSRAGSASIFLKPEAISEEKLAIIRKLNAIAQSRGQSLAQMALSWVLRHPQVTSVLIGASRPEQIKENVSAAAKSQFTAEELTAIDTALAGR